MDNNFFDLMEQKTGWSKELLYQLVESVKDYAIFVSDLDGMIVSWNVGAEKLFGYTAKQAIGQKSSILFTDEDRTEHVPEQELKTARDEGYAEDERWHVRRDGSLFFASGIQTPLYDETGKHSGYAKIARDLTERIDLQEEIADAKNTLEVRVTTRTSELNESNNALRREISERAAAEKLRAVWLRKIVRVQEDERKRIAREIHDHIGQGITGLKLRLQFFQNQYQDNPEINDHLKSLQAMVNQIDSDVDFLAWELRPSVLDDLGLTVALKNYVAEWSVQFNTPAEFNRVGLDEKNLLPETEINLYRIGQEALNNTAKYARAKSVSVLLEQRADNILLIIEDDGIGFEPTASAVLTGNDRGMGLLGMKERAELVGGSFEIESSPGNGTTVFVRVPAQFSTEERLP